jgi:oligosaccharide repeat unit polymerase
VGWMITLGSQLGLIPSSFGSGALGAISTGSYFGVGVLGILHARFRSRPALLLIWLVIPPAMAIAFLTGSKRFMLAPLMLAALGYYVVNRRVDTRWVVVGVGLVMVLYPVSQFWREIVLAGNQLRMADVLQNPARALSLISGFAATIDPGDYFFRGIQSTTARLDALGIVAVIVRDTPERVDFQGGWTLLHVPISFIPRIIWADKPILSLGQWITDNYGAGPDITSNTGSSWIGEFYLNFGYAGVIVGMGVLGAYFRFLHEIFFRVNTVPAQLSCLVVLWATCTTIEMNLIAPFNGVIFTLFLVLFGHMAARMFGGARPGANDDLAPAAQPTRSEFDSRPG